ncbi:MAG: FtsQ-type POTRA domain-containing protein, partial [Desulfobacterota bacterium]|nr:FtsQ-type POTRA domain-containing protein [Thermodesulfobacteriota bacterium]
MIDLDYYYTKKIINNSSRIVKRKPIQAIKFKKVLLFVRRIILFCTLAILTVMFFYYGLNLILHSPYLRLEHIRFEGCNNVSPQDLMKLAHIERGVNIISLNLKEIYQKIISNPWIKEVKIERNFPHTLIIKIVERVPVALVHQGKFFLVDQEGNLFKEIEPRDPIDFPIITGFSPSSNNQQQLKVVLRFLDTADHLRVIPKNNVSEVHLEGEGRITLYTLNENILIKMDLTQYSEKLSFLQKLKGELAERQIQPQRIEIISLDEAVKLLMSGEEKKAFLEFEKIGYCIDVKKDERTQAFFWMAYIKSLQGKDKKSHKIFKDMFRNGLGLEYK